jgi:hypothetical protein
MDEKDVNREARLQRMCERLGVDAPRCVRCGLDEVRCLEAHHIAGRKRVGHFLKGLADLLALLVAKMHEYGDEFIEFAKREIAPKTIGGER